MTINERKTFAGTKIIVLADLPGHKTNCMKHTGIPVLMYHSISDHDTQSMGKNASVSLEMFKAQMDWLHKEGYKTINHETLSSYLHGSAAPDAKYVMLTFDDGYRSWHTHARNILDSYGFTATMFLYTGYVGSCYDKHDFRCTRHDRPLNWNEVKDLADSGWSVQAHGNHQYKWTTVPLNDIAMELTVCKNEIEQHLGSEVNTLAYPFGFYSSAILRHLEYAGYHSAYAVHTGKSFPSSPIMRIPRIEMNSLDTITTFIRKVQTGFSSPSEELRTSVGNMLFGNPHVKDIVRMVTGG